MAEAPKKSGGQSLSRPQVERIGYFGIGGAQGRPIAGNVGIRTNRTARETGNQVARMMRALNNRTDLTDQEREERIARIEEVARETRRGLSATRRGYNDLTKYGDAYVNQAIRPRNGSMPIRRMGAARRTNRR